MDGLSSYCLYSGLSIPLLGLSYSILVSLGLLQKSCFGKKELAIDFLWSISHHHSVKIPDLRGLILELESRINIPSRKTGDH